MAGLGYVEGRLDVQWDKLIDPDIKALTVRTAYDALREEVGKGFDPQPVVVTDGMPRRAPEQVREFGKIEWIARADAVEVAKWINAQLFRLSPVRSGRYRQSHIWMVNGAQVSNWSTYRPGDRIQIVSTVPYARKLEGRPARTTGAGRNRKRTPGLRGASKQAPQGIYRVVHRLALARYGRSLFIDFKYVPLNLGVTVRGKRGKSRAQVYPAIQIYLKPS